jgi:hypothetical protein
VVGKLAGIAQLVDEVGSAKRVLDDLAKRDNLRTQLSAAAALDVEERLVAADLELGLRRMRDLRRR